MCPELRGKRATYIVRLTGLWLRDSEFGRLIALVAQRLVRWRDSRENPRLNRDHRDQPFDRAISAA